MSAQKLITEHLDLWTGATVRKSSSGRGSNRKIELSGIKKLRELILDLAVRGKLVGRSLSGTSSANLISELENSKARLFTLNKRKNSGVVRFAPKEDCPFDIPKTWSWHTLGALGHTQTGSTPAKSNSALFGADIPFLKPGDISENGKIFYENEGLSEAGKSALGKWAEKDSILMVCIGTIGKCGLIDRQCTLNQQINAITPYITETSKFLFLCLRSPYFQKAAWERSSSTTISILNKGKWEAIPVPLPPLEEQRLIVQKVDELMALCDRLEQQTSDQLEAHETLVDTLLGTLTQSEDATDLADNWARLATHFDTLFTTEQSIEKLKQTILQLAVMGRLVEQDEGDEPTSRLLRRIAEDRKKLVFEGMAKEGSSLPELAEAEKPFKIPTGWLWTRIQNVSEFITSGSRDWAKYQSDSGAIFITMGNLSRGDYRLRMENLRHVSPPAGSEGARTSLQTGDIVISITGDVGNLGLIPDNFGEAYINQHSCLVRISSLCRNRYFAEFLRSPCAKAQFDEPQRGIKNSFRLSDMANMAIPLPPLEEQHRIVQKVDELMALCDQLKEGLSEASKIRCQLADAIVEGALH